MNFLHIIVLLQKPNPFSVVSSFVVLRRMEALLRRWIWAVNWTPPVDDGTGWNEKFLLYGTKSVLQLCARIITPPLSKNYKDSTGQRTKIHRYLPIFRCARCKLSLAQGRLDVVKSLTYFIYTTLAALLQGRICQCFWIWIIIPFDKIAQQSVTILFAASYKHLQRGICPWLLLQELFSDPCNKWFGPGKTFPTTIGQTLIRHLINQQRKACPVLCAKQHLEWMSIPLNSDLKTEKDGHLHTGSYKNTKQHEDCNSTPQKSGQSSILLSCAEKYEIFTYYLISRSYLI